MAPVTAVQASPNTHYLALDKRLPTDASPNLAIEALNWLKGYDITYKEIVDNQMLWSPLFRQLIYPVYEGTEVIAWQAKNFNKAAKKYYNSGDFKDILDIHGLTTERPRAIILVEDKISAIRCARHAPTLCLYGSQCDSANFMRLKNITDSIMIWLDYDKARKSVEMTDMARSLGLKAHPIVTKEDPKCYHDSVIVREVKT